ncbi:hypothetical protein KR093_002625 [Drosophila rubida]|uniref:C2H2-type domain-containing protein n=1 Tax=Drosophila rubida TaxID=30044 RepID=A0AAD4KA63_9MUSC|nr:hypothetical protein KR093_002625 [Drosophila rubida]
MSLNIDMSEIIEFVLPTKSEYTEHDIDDDDDEGGGHNNNNEEEEEELEEDAEADADQYVVLETVDMAGDYKNEEFLLVNDDGTESELLLGNASQLQHCPELLQHAMLRLPKEEGMQYLMAAETEELDDLVEEEQQQHDEEEEEEEEIYEEMSQEDEEQFEQYEDDEQQLQQSRYSWNYVQATPDELEAQPQQQAGFLTDEELEDVDDLNYEELEELTPMALETPQPPPQQQQPPQQLAKPSEKLLDMFKGPRRYMLFDELIATIVDFDEDGTPIVEFSMIGCLQDEKLPVECGICPDVMHKSKLSKHQKTHLVPGTNRYACIYCSETYRDCKYLAGHARRHMGIRPYVCEPCKLYFSTKQDLRVHNQRRHLEKEHICEMCGKTFAQNTQLKRHREATHEKKRRFQCQYCQKAYYKNFSLQEHIRNVHMGKRRMLKCPFCGMQCRDAHKMARHRKEMHLHQDTYVCHLCQEEFTDINYFDAHKRSIQCRSNTRRLVDDGAVAGTGAEQGGEYAQEGDELGDLLEEDYDEDAGLLQHYVDEEHQQQHDHGQQQQLLYESINGYQQDEQQQEHHQLQQEQQQQHYEDDSLLVEQLHDDEEEDEDELEEAEQLLEDDEQQFLQQQAMYQQHHQQQQLQLEQHQQQQPHRQYTDDELIYEITLETEDN